MATFNDAALLKKLAELNQSQQSIQTLSLWLIHHRKHYASIVKIWFKELQNASESRILVLMYLANDVIQNSKKKGPEYNKEFALVLPKVCSLIGEKCKTEKVLHSIGRTINIWEERGVYDPKLTTELRARLNREHGKAVSADSKASTAAAGSYQRPEGARGEKRKQESLKHESKSSKIKKPYETETIEVKNSGDETVTLTPYMQLGDPPEPEDLIKALMKLENAASCDVKVRERIANLPPEIAQLAGLSKIEDKETAKKRAKQVNAALELLDTYNARLAIEINDRIQLAAIIKSFEVKQVELLNQAQQRLETNKKRLAKVQAVHKEVKHHASNLPDLNQLPDVINGGLAQLPSVDDLFNEMNEKIYENI